MLHLTIRQVVAKKNASTHVRFYHRHLWAAMGHYRRRNMTRPLVSDLVNAARIWSLGRQEDTLPSKDMCHTVLYGKWLPKKSLPYMFDSGLGRTCAKNTIFRS